MKWVLWIVIAAVVLVGGYYGAKALKHSMVPAAVVQSTAPTATPMPTAVMSPSPSATAGQQITIVGTEFAFTPSTITVKKGQPVTITFKNQGTYPHNFTLSDLNVHTATIEPGQTATVTFTPSQTGSFTYICTVPGHADRGMKGTLTVE